MIITLAWNENNNKVNLFNLKFSIDSNMYPPHPHEYSVDMIQFLLNNPDLMDSLRWQLDSSRSAIWIDQLIHLPSPLSYRPVSENSTQLKAWFFTQISTLIPGALSLSSEVYKYQLSV